MSDSDRYGPEETEQRLRKTLAAAFNMKPTPLKAIPKKNGESRKISDTRKAAGEKVGSDKRRSRAS